MKTIRNSNYEEDDRSYFSGFLEIMAEEKSKNSNALSTRSANLHVTAQAVSSLNVNELNVLYWIAGYVIYKIRFPGKHVQSTTVCNNCLLKVVCEKPKKLLEHHAFTDAKCKNVPFSVTCITEEAFQNFKDMDSIFRAYYGSAHDAKISLRSFFLAKFAEIPFTVPTCHKLKEKIAKGIHFE